MGLCIDPLPRYRNHHIIPIDVDSFNYNGEGKSNMEEILNLLDEADIEYEVKTEQLSVGIANWARTDLIKGKGKDLMFTIHVELELFEISIWAKKNGDKAKLKLFREIMLSLEFTEGEPSTTYNFQSSMGPLANFITWEEFINFSEQLRNEKRPRNEHNPCTLLWKKFCEQYPSVPQIPEGVHPQGFILSQVFYWIKANSSEKSEKSKLANAMRDFVNECIPLNQQADILLAANGISKKDIALLNFFGITEGMILDLIVD